MEKINKIFLFRDREGSLDLTGASVGFGGVVRTQIAVVPFSGV